MWGGAPSGDRQGGRGLTGARGVTVTAPRMRGRGAGWGRQRWRARGCRLMWGGWVAWLWCGGWWMVSVVSVDAGAAACCCRSLAGARPKFGQSLVKPLSGCGRTVVGPWSNPGQCPVCFVRRLHAVHALGPQVVDPPPHASHPPTLALIFWMQHMRWKPWHGACMQVRQWHS